MRTIDNLVDLVKEIANTFDRERIPYAVNGAVALNACGVVRATPHIFATHSWAFFRQTIRVIGN